MKNMFAQYANMFMMKPKVIPTAELLRAQSGKTCPQIGFAPFAV